MPIVAALEPPEKNNPSNCTRKERNFVESLYSKNTGVFL